MFLTFLRWQIHYHLWLGWHAEGLAATDLAVSYNKPTRCTDFSNLFLERNSTYFGQFGQEIFTLHTEKCFMSYKFAVCTVRNIWWWTEKLCKTCRISFQEYIWEISAFSWLYYKKFSIMYGHMNINNEELCTKCIIIQSRLPCEKCVGDKQTFNISQIQGVRKVAVH
jgi:hypothetical protein